MKLLTIGELIDQSWERYREQIGSYLSISGWTLIVAILNVIAIAFYPSASKLLLEETITGMETFGVVLYSISTLVLAPLINTFVIVGIVRMARCALRDQTVSIKRTVGEIKKRFWPTFLASVMYILVIVLGILLPLLPAGIFGLISLWTQNSLILTLANVLLTLGIFVGTFLSIRWGVAYYLTPYLVAQEDVRPRAALLQSRALVNGRFWQVFIRILAPKVVFILFGVLMIWVLNMILLILFSGVGGLSFDADVRLTSYTDNVIPLIVTVIIQPLVILSDILLIKTLKSETKV